MSIYTCSDYGLVFLMVVEIDADVRVYSALSHMRESRLTRKLDASRHNLCQIRKWGKDSGTSE